MAQKNYDETSIQILEGLEAVRKRPGMYIGSTDQRGLHHLVWEIVDNAMDEVLAGFGDEISVTIKADNSIEVLDNGRGMPYKMHQSGVPTTQVIFTVLHAGGKFGGDGSYKVAGGLHGVGSSVVNALSVALEVTVFKDGGMFRQRFENGGKKILPLERIGDSKKTGTQVWFKPDPTIFSTTLYNYETIKERLKESAFLIKGLKINLSDQRKNLKESFKYDDGIKAYVELLNTGKNTLHEVKDVEGNFSASKQAVIEVEVALQYTDGYQDNIISFVNNVRTKDGGSHEVGFKSALTKVINDYARKYNFIKEKDDNIDGVDIREGLTAIVSLRIPEAILEFEGQTKSKLGTPEARNALEAVFYEKFNTYLEENSDIASKIIGKAIAASQAREAARKAREDARAGKKRSKKEVILSGKLTPAQGKDKQINELFLVEGDSAGGSAKQGRNRLYQAILPLRGKVINTERTNTETILKNEEISTMIYTIGADFGEDFDITKCNYKKVIIMTDADDDGAHIQVLLLTFFFRYMKPLIEDGRLYIAQPPLYKVSRKKSKKEDIVYAWSDDELKEILDKTEGSYTIQRYKGLGEMNFAQLWETTMNPESRTLIQVTVDDYNVSDKYISTLMGDQVQPRREWIESHVDFEVTDDFDIEGKSK
ncbi:DNA topoisomerase 4 subunit B [Acholeplasma oculi]|uniref:DNA topoisomerase (ATP-hydrolyzing) n=1 Tax=Acholeplasma oculi TaxID=35623 RepID=A0A061AHQ8_9MOLU|nr:DNA topoisomerase IV subunit B [Acholeplasma oculi]CDR31131.1 DNA topoisomerase 4 subunit B [Acholeplasma oculi]SKC37306.1 topoisomerase-4 subunit B [Acholeplasma oculi]SUT90892.1 DNA topoisomerase 4 subunit B [Acholeplasma oculi]